MRSRKTKLTVGGDGWSALYLPFNAVRRPIMPKTHSYYDSLKVTRDAPADVIRAAYRTLSQRYHPDRNPGDKSSADVMVLLNSAYAVLSDPARRSDHDNWLASMEGAPGEMPATTYPEGVVSDEEDDAGESRHLYRHRHVYGLAGFLVWVSLLVWMIYAISLAKGT